MCLVTSERDTGAKARVFCFSGWCFFLLTELKGIRGQDLDLRDTPRPRGMNLCPQAQGSTPSALFLPFPFLHVNPEATGLLVGMAARAPHLAYGGGRGEQEPLR